MSWPGCPSYTRCRLFEANRALLIPPCASRRSGTLAARQIVCSPRTRNFRFGCASPSAELLAQVLYAHRRGRCQRGLWAHVDSCCRPGVQQVLPSQPEFAVTPAVPNATNRARSEEWRNCRTILSHHGEGARTGTSWPVLTRVAARFANLVGSSRVRCKPVRTGRLGCTHRLDRTFDSTNRVKAYHTDSQLASRA